jgi:hypothetical protein
MKRKRQKNVGGGGKGSERHYSLEGGDKIIFDFGGSYAVPVLPGLREGNALGSEK